MKRTGHIVYCLAALLVLLFAGCKEFQEVKVTGVRGFKMNKMSADGMEAEIIIGVKNPNNVGFTIYPSEFDVTFSGVHLGKARLHRRVHIDRNCEKEYAFKLKSSLKDLNLMELTGLLNSRKLGTVEVKGDLKAGKFFHKIRYPVDVREKMNLSR